MPTTVVNVRRGLIYGRDFDVYLGRQGPYTAKLKLPADYDFAWGNPYPLIHDTPEDRVQVCLDYQKYLLSQPKLLARLPELAGKRLGCWCTDHVDGPLRCHGQILAHHCNHPRKLYPIK